MIVTKPVLGRPRPSFHQLGDVPKSYCRVYRDYLGITQGYKRNYYLGCCDALCQKVGLSADKVYRQI